MVTANWPAAVIAAPTIFNFNLKNYSKPNAIGHEDTGAGLPSGTADLSALDRSYTGLLHFFAKNTTDFEKIIEGNLKMFADHTDMWISQSLQNQEERQGFVYGELTFGHEQHIETTAW